MGMSYLPLGIDRAKGPASGAQPVVEVGVKAGRVDVLGLSVVCQQLTIRINAFDFGVPNRTPRLLSVYKVVLPGAKREYPADIDRITIAVADRVDVLRQPQCLPTGHQPARDVFVRLRPARYAQVSLLDLPELTEHGHRGRLQVLCLDPATPIRAVQHAALFRMLRKCAMLGQVWNAQPSQSDR